MFYYPYYDIIANCCRQQPITSAIRVLHASPNTPSIDVYANGNIIAKNLAYKEFLKYIPIPSGNYNIKIYTSGEIINPIINTIIYIPEHTVSNLASIGEPLDTSLHTIPEPVLAQNLKSPCIRFVNLSPNSPAVDIKLSDGTKIIGNVAYKEITNYLCAPSETYSFIITPTGSNNVLLAVPNLQLHSNNYYTMYLVGLVEKSPYLEILLAPEPR